MTGLIIRMVREFPNSETADGGVVHARIFPSGEIAEAGGQASSRSRQEMDAVRANQARAGSQLLTIRHLRLMGWRVTDPSLWEEAEA